VGTAEQKSLFYQRLCQIAFLQERYRISADTIALGRQSALYAQETDHAWYITRSQFLIGFLQLWHGSFNEAEDKLQQALNGAGKIGDLWSQNQILAYLTTFYRFQGYVDQFTIYQSQFKEVSEAAGSPTYTAVWQANTAWLHYHNGQLQDAWEQAQEAVATWGDVGNPFRWLAHWILLAVALERGQTKDAIRSAKVMLDPIQQKLPDEVTASLEGAVKSWEDKQDGETKDYLEKGVKLAQEKGYL
jgi:hypothetical protein